MIPYCFWMDSQVLPLVTLCHLLHAQTDPGCVGVGTLGQAVVVGLGGSVEVPGMPDAFSKN